MQRIAAEKEIPGDAVDIQIVNDRTPGTSSAAMRAVDDVGKGTDDNSLFRWLISPRVDASGNHLGAVAIYQVSRPLPNGLRRIRHLRRVKTLNLSAAYSLMTALTALLTSVKRTFARISYLHIRTQRITILGGVMVTISGKVKLLLVHSAHR